ncbi:MAG TPA: hypothetical protein VJX67_23940 [Blastocatellia bacterium]|nr:hypothetical protein [Blastocatellia bacterium]
MRTKQGSRSRVLPIHYAKEPNVYGYSDIVWVFILLVEGLPYAV